jgi:hypothetical protein
VPDFRVILAEQFTIAQSRIDDQLRSGPLAAWLEHDTGYAEARLDPALASAIAEQELASLQEWLERHWHQRPRDTRVLQKILKVLPGGERLTKWSETAPYLLAIIVATHHAFFGPVDLVILGSFSLATWLAEKMSNEVAGRTRETNRRIAERFEALVHEQIERVCDWIERSIPRDRELQKIERLRDELGEMLDLR